ncbi:hypothetical protein WMY93_033547 [Mugilogobius chulae]|uniref:Uncharacterized protein n=1 Tax=Mugilogobius chulae TaxID=88201 RepID=A0AAW0MIH3_9GOBI
MSLRLSTGHKVTTQGLKTESREEEEVPGPSCSGVSWKEQNEKQKQMEDCPNHLLQETDKISQTKCTEQEQLRPEDDHLRQELELKMNHNAALRNHLERLRRDLEETRTRAQSLSVSNGLKNMHNEMLTDSLDEVRKELREAKAKLGEMQEKADEERGDDETNLVKTAEEKLEKEEQKQQMMEEFLEQQKSDFVRNLEPQSQTVNVAVQKLLQEKEEEQTPTGLKSILKSTSGLKLSAKGVEKVRFNLDTNVTHVYDPETSLEEFLEPQKSPKTRFLQEEEEEVEKLRTKGEEELQRS